MPSQHRYPAAIYRTDPGLRQRARIAVKQVDSDLNSHIAEFLRWLVGDTDEFPRRPSGQTPQSKPDLQPESKPE